MFQHLELNAQNRIVDSLKLALKNAKHDSTRSITLGFLCKREADNKLKMKLVTQRLAIVESNLSNKNQSTRNFFLKEKAGTYNQFGIIYRNQGDLPQALEYNYKSLKIKEELGDSLGMANSLNNIAIIFYQQANIPIALEYYNKSLKINQEIGNASGIATCLSNIGVIYKGQGDISKTIEYYLKSLKIREEIGDKRGVAVSLDNIGSMNLALGDLPLALEYYHKSLKIFEQIGDKQSIAGILTNIGTVYYNQKNLSKASEYWHKSLKIMEDIGDKKGMASCLNNIGQVTSLLNDNTKAIVYYHQSLKICEELGDKIGITNALNSIALVYSNQGNLKQAIAFGVRSMSIAKEVGFPENIKMSAKALKTIYQKQNKYKEAFEMYELEIKMRDSINNQETQKAAVKKQMQYTYEKKAALDSTAHAKENEINNAEITARKAELKVKQNTQYALYGGLALVLVFAGFMFNRFKVTQKQKHIIEIKEKETQQQKHIIEQKHKQITDSINYAERIQRSFIATKEMLDENLSSLRGTKQFHTTDEIATLPLVARNDGADYFVFFKPKDVVSGDFYWASYAKASAANGQRDLFYLVTADSTGHGVPGAIMSLLNITSLEKAIETLTEPSEILNSTRKTIIERLKKDGSEHGGKDGMDASLCVFDFKNKKLIVAAANNPVWIVRARHCEGDSPKQSQLAQIASATPRNDVIEIKPDKMPVGKHDKDTVSFTQQTIDLQSGDVVYTLTDGFPDQFGGEKGKKFMSKNLKELLAKNAHLPMHEQKQILEKTFANWVGDLEQVDDVTLIGVRI